MEVESTPTFICAVAPFQFCDQSNNLTFYLSVTANPAPLLNGDRFSYSFIPLKSC